MQKHFKNQRKLNAIEQLWQRRPEWSELRPSLRTVDDLARLPYIGEITKFHIARNIGLISCAKPDLHLCRWCKKITGRDDEAIVPIVTQALADRVSRKQGTVDFALWVWLSHTQGDAMDCCNGGYALR